MRIKIFVLLLAIGILAGCENGDGVSGSGAVRYMSFEGGFFGIVADNGSYYLPENLPSDFMKDSLRVSFEGTITDKMTVQQWGRTINLTKIVRIQ